MKECTTKEKPSHVQPQYDPYTQDVGPFRASKGKAQAIRFFYPIFNNGAWAEASADGYITYGVGISLQRQLRVKGV